MVAVLAALPSLASESFVDCDRQGSVFCLNSVECAIAEPIDSKGRMHVASVCGRDAGIEPHVIADLNAAATGAVNHFLPVFTNDGHRGSRDVGNQEPAASHRDIGMIVGRRDGANDHVVDAPSHIAVGAAAATVFAAFTGRGEIAEVGHCYSRQ